MKGSELALEVKTQYPRLPVVMITAYMETLPKNLPGVDHMIGKPFLLEDLRNAIKRFSPPTNNQAQST
jgi:CheY-like chemotaxis protein